MASARESYSFNVDAELREQEREFAAEPTTARLAAYGRRLVKAGRLDDLRALVPARDPRDLIELGARELARADADEWFPPENVRTSYPVKVQRVSLVSWQLPDELGGITLLSLSRPGGSILLSINPADSIALLHADVFGDAAPDVPGFSEVRHRPSGGRAILLAVLLWSSVDRRDGRDVSEELVEQFFGDVAKASGASLVSERSFEAWD